MQGPLPLAYVYRDLTSEQASVLDLLKAAWSIDIVDKRWCSANLHAVGMRKLINGGWLDEGVIECYSALVQVLPYELVLHCVSCRPIVISSSCRPQSSCGILHNRLVNPQTRLADHTSANAIVLNAAFGRGLRQANHPQSQPSEVEIGATTLRSYFTLEHMTDRGESMKFPVLQKYTKFIFPVCVNYVHWVRPPSQRS